MTIYHIRGAGSALLALVLLLGGCGKETAKIDMVEIRDPLIRKARAKVDQGDRIGALACLNQVLEKRPGVAQAHLEAALLYDDFQKDYVRAIYHYQRYLELRPGTDKKDMIEGMIRKARISFAASVSDQRPDFSENFKALEDENARLKNELRVARKSLSPQVRKTTAPGPVAQAGATAGPATQPVLASALNVPAAPPGQVYVVQEHETLSMIAAKLYRNPGKWKVIYEANRQTLASPEKLRAGQTLIIPPKP